MGKRITGAGGRRPLHGAAHGSAVARRGNLEGLEGAIASLLVSEADPALRDPDADDKRTARAKEARKAARARVRKLLPREQADALLAEARARAIDLFGVRAAPEEVRARLIEGARDAVATAHADRIGHPFGILRSSRGRRLVAIADAMIDRGQITLDPVLLKSAAYLLDRGLAQMAAARADARVREEEERHAPHAWGRALIPPTAINKHVLIDPEPEEPREREEAPTPPPAPENASPPDVTRTIHRPAAEATTTATTTSPTTTPPTMAARPAIRTSHVSPVSGCMTDGRTWQERLEDDRAASARARRPARRVFDPELGGWIDLDNPPLTAMRAARRHGRPIRPELAAILDRHDEATKRDEGEPR